MEGCFLSLLEALGHALSTKLLLNHGVFRGLQSIRDTQ